MKARSDGAFQVPGYRLFQNLSDRARSKLFLAQATTGSWVALKFEFPEPANRIREAERRYQILQALAKGSEGWTPILDYGVLPSGWIWHAMPLADNLPDLAPLDSEAGVLGYTPFTLAAWTLENGPAPAVQVAKWGQGLCSALGQLHRSGLVHRDVKPANLLFLNGALCLGDYGLVGEPGSAFDQAGTEGFVPLEGSADPAADLFALGKTLYQAWSGRDRLEFPSLPASVPEDPSWKRFGFPLNEVLLRACHPQPNRRYRTVEDLSGALDEVLLGRPRGLGRRRWLAATGTLVLGTAAYGLLHPVRPVATAVWRRLRGGFNVESWRGHFGTVDWRKGRLYSLCREVSGFWFHTLDLSSFELKTRTLEPLPSEDITSLLHPPSGNLWAVEGGLGNVYEVNVETAAVRNLGGGPCSRRNFAAALYWNPITGRLGTFGGYGFFRVNNTRHEFDLERGRWVEMAHERSEVLPWPREVPRPLFPGSEPTRLFLGGGNGSPSGRQGDNIPGLRGFNSQFHWLDDLWVLDLRTNRWSEVLANGIFPLPPQETVNRSMFYHPELEGVVVLSPAYTEGGPNRPSFWLFRPGLDRKPVPLPQTGDVSSIGSAWAYTLDPKTLELLLLGPEAVYRIAFQRPS